MRTASSKNNTQRHTRHPNSDILQLTDFCKGLAILWIFLIHYEGGWFGWQGVHIFLVLGGLGLTYSCLKKAELIQWSKWFLKRCRRIFPAYWVAVVLTLPLLIVFQIILGEPLWIPFVRTGLDLVLLTNLFDEFRGGASGAFWYVSFIFGAYLLFPFLYGWLKDKLNWRGCLSLLAITVGIEFAYRAIALYWFDGLPISYDDQRFLAIFPNSVEPLDHHVDWFFGFFQRRAPFGFIFSRLGEFVLGMLLAVALINDRSKANQRLLNLPMGVTGAVIWLVGQALMYVGLWGWIFSDFFITLGLILWTLNLAGFLQKISPTVFRTMTFLGMWSYYIYLVHQPFTRGARGVALMFVDPDAGMLVEIFANLLCLGLAAGCTAIASFLLMRFDTSRLADRMFARISQLVSVQNIQKIVSSK